MASPRFLAPALLSAVALLGAAPAVPAEAGEPALILEAKVALGKVSGRIDHMAADVAHGRLFVAELGNDSVGVVDLAGRQVMHRIAGLKEPQGVGYVPATDTLYVANAGDGSVRLFRGTGFAPAGQIALGEDADNVRVDDAGERVYVGYGAGALAVIEASSARKIADMALRAHPESFQLDIDRGRAYVNVPDAGAEIAVVDVATQRQIGFWRAPDARANFPMALDRQGGRLFVAFRHPARLVVFNTSDGKIEAALDLCGDADDVFFDAKRGRVYVSCGEGVVDVFAQQAGAFVRLEPRPTASGARTALFIPEIDRLFVAARAGSGGPAAILVFRPAP